MKCESLDSKNAVLDRIKGFTFAILLSTVIAVPILVAGIWMALEIQHLNHEHQRSNVEWHKKSTERVDLLLSEIRKNRESIEKNHKEIEELKR